MHNKKKSIEDNHNHHNHTKWHHLFSDNIINFCLLDFCKQSTKHHGTMKKYSILKGNFYYISHRNERSKKKLSCRKWLFYSIFKLTHINTKYVEAHEYNEVYEDNAVYKL